MNRTDDVSPAFAPLPLLAPSVVRARILDEHRRLRVSLARLQMLARDVTLDEGRLPQLRGAFQRLVLEFGSHLDSEDESLMPLVETLDAWGPERAARMREEHVGQRKMLDLMCDRLRQMTDALAFASEVDALVLRIFRDMHEEEAEILDVDLLRDDVVVIDQTCG